MYVRTVQLNVNLTFTRMSHESHSTNLLSHLWVTRECMIQYHNLILDLCEWCAHEVHYSFAMYRTYITCKLHAWPLLNHSSTNTPQCTQNTAIFRYCLVFLRHLECQRLLKFNRLVAQAKMIFFYFGKVVTKLNNTGHNWRGSGMVWTPIIHALTVSVYCVHCKVLVEEWFRGGHGCSLHVTYDTRLTSSAFYEYITCKYQGSNYDIVSCAHV